MNVGLFGGSFDPIHSGHVEPVKAALRRLDLDRVLYLVTADPPHKPGRVRAPAWARFAMVELALLEEPALFASALELTPGRQAYTVETLRHFRAHEPGWRLHLLVGADSYRDLETWREWREIERLAQVVVLGRPGISVARREGDRSVWIEEAPVPVSSTELRRQLAGGRAPGAEALHPRVLEYARKYRLY